jgi:transposase
LVKADGEWVKQHLPAEWFETYGEWTESERLVKESGAKGRAETERLLKQTGEDGFELLEKLAGSPQWERWRELEAIQTLAQVWQQQYRRGEKGSGAIEIELSTKESRQKEGVAREVIQTPHDVEARYGEKNGVGVVGYKLHLTEVAAEDAPALITDVDVVGCQEYDGAALEGIQQRLEARDVLPAEQVVDGGYVSGETISSSALRGVKLIGPVQAAPGSEPEATAPNPPPSRLRAESETPPVTQTCLSLERFQFDFARKTAVCPSGESASRWRETIRQDRGLGPEGQVAVLIYWPKQTCLGCPLALPSLIQQERGRIVQVSLHYPVLAQRRQEQKQAAFKETYRRRSGIEASLSELVRGHQGRRTPYRGRAKTRLHYLRMASAMNLKRAIAWEQGLRPKRQREVRMKKLLGLKQTTRQGWNRRVA